MVYTVCHSTSLSHLDQHVEQSALTIIKRVGIHMVIQEDKIKEYR